jgi:hypothetical protein
MVSTALREGCAAAICSAGEYAPEIEPGDAQRLRADLARLSAAISATLSAEEGRRLQAEVRTALQAHQRQAQGRLRQMRQKVEAAQTAIREFAAGICAGNAGHQGGLQEELEALKTVARMGDLTHIRSALGEACTGIRRSHAQLLRGQQLAMLQLHDEIRMLRENIAAHQRERERDAESGACQREHIDAEIRARLLRREAFTVLLLSIHNLGKLQAEHPPEAILGMFNAFFKRLAVIAGNVGSNEPGNPAGNGVVTARWSPHAFALLLPVAGERANQIRDQASARLPGAYAIQVAGKSRILVLDLSVAIIDPAVEFAANQ